MNAGGSSSRQILKSTAIIGGSNVVVALMRIGQLKILAVLLGPAGMGLMGLYSSVMSTVATIGGLGIASSGVQQISKASSSMDDRAAGTALVALRRLTIVLGAMTTIGLFLLRKVVSGWFFGSQKYAGAVGVLSLGVLCTIISGSQIAILNGLRRLKDIARINVAGAVIGASVTVLLVLFWREQALAYAIISTTVITLICSWWFVRRIPHPASTPGYAEVKTAWFSLFRLGAAFLFAGLVMTLALLFTRVIIIRNLGMASAGYFQAAWGFVVFYIDFILNAMGIDFYPHLTSRIDDREAANQLVNEQTEVALLLGGPLILGMLLFAPVLMFLFYSSEFGAATKLLRLLLLGNILKIISWPMGYLVMARAWVKLFVFIEVVWAATYLGFVYFGIRFLGADAVGYAFVGAYFIYCVVLYLILNRSGGFAWSSKNVVLAFVLSLSAVLVMTLTQQAGIPGYLFGGLVTLGIGIYSLRRLYRFVGEGTVAGFLSAIKNKLMPDNLSKR